MTGPEHIRDTLKRSGLAPVPMPDHYDAGRTPDAGELAEINAEKPKEFVRDISPDIPGQTHIPGTEPDAPSNGTGEAPAAGAAGAEPPAGSAGYMERVLEGFLPMANHWLEAASDEELADLAVKVSEKLEHLPVRRLAFYLIADSVRREVGTLPAGIKMSCYIDGRLHDLSPTEVRPFA